MDTVEPGSLPNGTTSRSVDLTTSSDTEERIEAYARDRDLLREEVAELRRSLEEIQVKHQHELEAVRQQLEETQGQKDHSDTQYRNLLGKVNGIKSQLGERLKADAVWHGLMISKLTCFTDGVARKSCRRQEAGLKSWKSGMGVSRKRMMSELRNSRLLPKKASSGRRSFRVCEIGQTCRSRIGSRKGKT